MSTTLVTFQSINRDIGASLKRTSQQPAILRETEHYRASISKIDTIDQFLADDRIYNYAMKALGLEEMTYAKAFMKKVLTEGIDDPKSFANSLSDKRYREFAERFNFERYGASATTFGRAQQGVIDAYVRQTLEEQAGQSNDGVRLALYFQRKAPDITDAAQFLAEPALLKVAETIFGLNLSSGDIEKNAALIRDRFDVADLQDPEKLARLLTRFTAMWEISQPSTTTGISILFSQQTETGVSQNLLESIQNLKLNGR